MSTLPLTINFKYLECSSVPGSDECVGLASAAKPILFYLGAIIDYERVFKPHGLTFLGTAGVGVLSI